MHDKRKSFASCLTTFAVAAVAFMVVTPEPALAGMGTGNPPPPPPPPLTVTKRQFETSNDGALTGVGYPGQVIMHSPRDINTGTTSVQTTGSGLSGGNFTYTVYEGESPQHRGYLFGCPSNGWTNQDIVINTDAGLVINIPSDASNEDYTRLAANPGASAPLTWKWEYEVDRGKEWKITKTEMFYATKSLGKVFVPRHMDAKPNDIDKKAVTFQLKKLEGSDSAGVVRFKWIDDPTKGRITLVPQQKAPDGSDVVLNLHKVVSVVQK